MQSINRVAIVATWRAMLGLPFAHQGRSVENGVDCIGLVMLGFLEGGWIPLHPKFSTQNAYRRLPESGSLTRGIELECDEIAFGEVLPGDAILFAWEGVDELPRHVAGVTNVEGEGQTRRVSVIHTHWQLGRVCEHGLDALWESRIVSCWRLKGLI